MNGSIRVVLKQSLPSCSKHGTSSAAWRSHASYCTPLAKKRSGFMWNAVIRESVCSGSHQAAVSLYDEMLACEQLPDNFTFPFLLKSCGNLPLGVQIHAQAIVTGYAADVYTQNALLAMYMKCGRWDTAVALFDDMPVSDRTVVSWNTMIAGYFHNGLSKMGMSVFHQMMCAGVEPDSATLVSLLPVCTCLNDLQSGRQVHRYAKDRGLDSVLKVRNALIDMYAKCGSLADARKVFEEGEKDVVSWTAMLGGYVLSRGTNEVLSLSWRMFHASEIVPNSVTLVNLLSACASWPSALKHGKCIHGAAIRRHGGLQLDVVVETALITMYATCRRLDLGRRLLVNTSRRRTAPWNALLSGYTQNGLPIEAIRLFKEMLIHAIPNDKATIICILPAYTQFADLQHAKSIHGHLISSGCSDYSGSIEITTALIHMYSESGSIDSARLLFDELSSKDIVSWTAIIAGYGMHGRGKDAVFLFNQMIQSGMEPNEVTFTSTLYACSHAGLVDEGLHLFTSMSQHQLQPHVDHYACIVDLLGRAGRLREAYDLIMAMPFEANHAVWGALLGACTVYENVEMGEVAARHLFRLEPHNTGNYVLLANLYAAAGRWNDVIEVRAMKNERGLRKTPGWSL